MHDSVLSVTAPASGVKGTVRVPGDKSISHRALILSAMAEGTSTITGLSLAEDPTSTRGALAQFGVAFVDQPDGTVVVHGGLRHEPFDVLDCGNAGTGIRLLSGVCACSGDMLSQAPVPDGLAEHPIVSAHTATYGDVYVVQDRPDRDPGRECEHFTVVV